MTLASGSRAIFSYVRERTRGVTPLAVGTPTSIAAAGITVGVTSSRTTFTRGTGDWTAEGFAPGQKITNAGFDQATDGLGACNGTFTVYSVTATVLTITENLGVTGATATGGPTTFEIRLRILRATTRPVNLKKNVLDSAEVRTSGQKADSRHGFVSIEGAPAFQLSIEDFDDVFEYVMRNTFSTVTLSAPTTIAFTAVTNGIVSADCVGVDYISEGLRPGDFVTIALMASANNGRYRVLTIVLAGSDTEMTLAPAIDGAAPVTETANASATCTYPGKRIDLGNALTSWAAERQFQDIAKYQPFRGVGANSMQVTVSPEAMIVAALNLLGMGSNSTDEGKLNASSIGNSSPLSASSNPPFAAFDGSLFEGGVEFALVTSFDFTVALNRSLEPVVGSKFSPDIFDGTAGITGNMTVFLDDSAAVYDKFVDETESSLAFSAESADQADFINFVMPRVKYNSADIDPPQSGAVPQATAFEALEHSTYGTAMWIQVSNS